MSYIGIIGAKRLDRHGASCGLIDTYNKAMELKQKGMEMHFVKKETGWEMGCDGKWRYEIEDPFHTALWIEDYIKRYFGEPINIRYCMRNTDLLVAYPEFERLQLFALYAKTNIWIGYFDPNRYAMVVCMGTIKSPFEQQTEGILLHEVQHLIQDVEDFARGGNLSLGYDRYYRLAGEVEARNICLRHFLSDTERREKLRTDTQDVKDVEQIIRFYS